MSGLDTLLIRAQGARKAPARQGIARAYRIAAVDGLRHRHAQLLAVAQVGDAQAQLAAMLAAGEGMQRVQDMARRAMRQGVAK